MAHHYEDDIIGNIPVEPVPWFYEGQIRVFISKFGVYELLKIVPNSDIEKYLRKEKLKNIEK